MKIKKEVIGFVNGVLHDKDFIVKIGSTNDKCQVWCNGEPITNVQKIEIIMDVTEQTKMIIHTVLI